MYNIKTTIESGVFDGIMMSTDSEKIEEIIGGGASVPFTYSKTVNNVLRQ